jgi:hypothetical protein
MLLADLVAALTSQVGAGPRKCTPMRTRRSVSSRPDQRRGTLPSRAGQLSCMQLAASTCSHFAGGPCVVHADGPPPRPALGASPQADAGGSSVPPSLLHEAAESLRDKEAVQEALKQVGTWVHRRPVQSARPPPTKPGAARLAGAPPAPLHG